MTVPVRLQLSRQRGFNLQALSRSINGLPAKVCTRASRKWGNPWKVTRIPRQWIAGQPAFQVSYYGKVVRRGTPSQCFRFAIAEHRKLARRRRAEIKAELAGFNLACTCRLDRACHVDILLELANK